MFHYFHLDLKHFISFAGERVKSLNECSPSCYFTITASFVSIHFNRTQPNSMNTTWASAAKRSLSFPRVISSLNICKNGHFGAHGLKGLRNTHTGHVNYVYLQQGLNVFTDTNSLRYCFHLMTLTKSSKTTSIKECAILHCCIAFIHSKDGDRALLIQLLAVNRHTANAGRNAVSHLAIPKCRN